jgi:DNA-binding transcriptional LysR family regulator
MIELRHLHYFRTLAQTLHFGRAAELLHISQPPLTRQIAALERELGVSLFDRGNRHVRLTKAGEQFFIDTTEVFDVLDRAKQNARSTSNGIHGTLLVGFMMSTAYNVLPSLTRRYSASYPEVNMKLIEYTPNVLAENIQTRKIDVGIMYRPEDCSNLHTKTIFSEPLLAVLPKNHPLAHAAIISAKQLSQDNFICIPKSIAPTVYDIIIKHCKSCGFKPNITLETNLQQTIVNLVGEGLGVAMVPRSMHTMNLETVVFIPLEQAPMVEVAVIWKKDNRNPCINTFVSASEDLIVKTTP